MAKTNSQICNEDMHWDPTRPLEEEIERLMQDPELSGHAEWMRRHMVTYRIKTQQEFMERDRQREEERLRARGGMPKRNYERHKTFSSGDRLGRLVLVDRDWQQGATGQYHDGYWIAKCDCGVEVRIHNTRLHQGDPDTKACPDCAPNARYGRQPYDITGMTFGRLVPRSHEYRVGWTCDCLTCGGECLCRDKQDVMQKGVQACRGKCTPKTPNAEQSDAEPSEPSGLTPGQVFGRLTVSEYFPDLGWLCLCLTCGGNELCESEEEVRRRGNVECDGACVNA